MTKSPLDRHALGRALTVLANASAAELLKLSSVQSAGSRAKRIGLTGAPGAGKSTLAGHLALYRANNRRMGILAVDPSSPKTGGAILGDRVRMDDLQGASELYIRSVASREASDGLADNLPEMLDLMDQYDFDEVFLETVGVGQAEYAARAQVDTLVLVLLPDSGDVVQAMKAGIMEMADIFVINKADLPGAHKMAADIKRMAAIASHPEGGWRPGVLLASWTQPESIAAVSAEIDRHLAWLSQSQRDSSILRDRARYRLKRLIERRVTDALRRLDPAMLDKPLAQQLEQVMQSISIQEDRQPSTTITSG